MQPSKLYKDLKDLKAYHELALETINRNLAQLELVPKREKVTSKMVAAAIAKRKSHLIKK